MLFNMAQHCWNLEVGVSNDQIRAICAINAYLIIGLSGGLVFFFFRFLHYPKESVLAEKDGRHPQIVAFIPSIKTL